ncbi:hypothetical protein B9G69_014545 [Bdellovibrio sp. SKB1291214]|uniref:hypothetical protein n=1 Tax=Bdellovibrio sp. SKB1291214 TaxID=1732569 RepID=UPI000B51587C|nr:hypothetical protein [Bdellovibrio sp. SKB1291214]UYL08265.1 hypothetical protein B9G69_014545 [Bdellovibrio sp. SKB1291214]
MQLLLSLLFAFPGFASTQAQDSLTCQDRVERGGSIQAQMRPTSNGNCFVSISNYHVTTMLYRGYVFAADGNLMVFNSFGSGPVSETTGAREFYTFPRRFKFPTFTWNEEQRVLVVTSTTGDEFYFDYETAQLKGMNKAEVQVSGEIAKTNAGGVEIKNYKGLIMDAGFKMGSAPTSNARGKVKFTDEAGKNCELTVGDIFSYREDGDPYVKFSDKNLASFLKKKCSKLKFPTL